MQLSEMKNIELQSELLSRSWTAEDDVAHVADQLTTVAMDQLADKELINCELCLIEVRLLLAELMD